MSKLRYRRQSAYTLIELLVVIGIVAFLASLLMMMWPMMQSATMTTSNADKIQAMLLIAKQRAIRDRVPTGVRLIQPPTLPPKAPAGSVWFNQLIYIQQPDPFTPTNAQQQITAYTAPRRAAGSGTATFSTTVDFFGGFAAANITNHPVQPGDYLEVNGGGILAKITAVNKTTLSLASAINLNNPTSHFRVIRMPRVLNTGEEPLVLSGTIIIDMTTNTTLGGTASRYVPTRSDGELTYYEIMFSPSGSVIGQGTTGASGQIILWVRDSYYSTAYPVQKDDNPLLIGIKVGTGLIGAYPVVNLENTRGSSNPYSETYDPHAGGL